MCHSCTCTVCVSIFYIPLLFPRPTEQIDEAKRLVLAAAEHEQLRVKHVKRMAVLRAQLEKLEAANGLVRHDVGFLPAQSRSYNSVYCTA